MIYIMLTILYLAGHISFAIRLFLRQPKSQQKSEWQRQKCSIIYLHVFLVRNQTSDKVL